MPKYHLELYNNNPMIDLRKKQNEIKLAAKELKDLGAGINQFTLLSVSQHFITIEVMEMNKDWHHRFGFRLANHHNMRNVCDPENKKRMFKWKVVKK